LKVAKVGSRSPEGGAWPWLREIDLPAIQTDGRTITILKGTRVPDNHEVAQMHPGYFEDEA
jgi:hypothetical protein